jgi:osmoprotectant transport system ATP-binding protein
MERNRFMAIFELNGVSKSFGDTPALYPLDLSIEAEKTTVLIGQSGCGKSTLIRLMVGLVLADTGSVIFEGKALAPAELPLLRRKMGYVIQEGGLFPHLTARENVCLMANHVGEAPSKVSSRLSELCELTHFPADGLDRYPAELSGGQRQRVSLMRALMLDPDVLLLDEPLGALDPMIRAGLQEELRDIFRSLNKTVVMVTHDIGEAGYFGDEIVLLREGRIVQTGSLEDLVKDPVEDFVTQFINAQRSPLEGLSAG